MLSLDVWTAAIMCNLSSERRDTPASSLASTAVEWSMPGGDMARGALTRSPMRESFPTRLADCDSNGGGG